MAAKGVKQSSEKDMFQSGYTTMVRSPPAVMQSSTNGVPLHGDPTDESDDTPIDIAEAGSVRPPQGGLQRFVRHFRVLEFGSAVLLYLLAVVFAKIKVHERPIPGIKVRLNATAVAWALDPSLDEIKLSEEVPMWLLLALGICLPVGTNLVVNYVLPVFCQVRVIAHDTRDFLLSLFQSMALATFLTQFTKNITGRFRPSFYDMCKWNHDVVWDGVTNLCTDPAGEKEGRKSFPSGHASFAWATMLILTLYLLGRSRLNFCLAAWISITRCIDNWHNYSDILAGSVIGVASALFAFNYNYGSIFSWDSAGLPLEEIHERRMKKAKKARSERLNQQPMLHHYFDSHPSLLKRMSSDCIVRDSTTISS
ncbi:hypothetical protein PF002_g2296 [Phytophthora fragariae]|uniref:Phosphatidic acid phosphatase type 2/haloperoxidase domain-containing protein n=1 Tax=Phytophthora fragariae TaxID=53985 RepID=A0A6A4ADM0_9STRA|nr:hypothetical protein PF004_g1927 [Phytophthora fragariae]KAE9255596.1 hypothetical protein PF002_g2296 [Phytophthora fragariae]KAE9327872.1 hypothetical protein PF001_g1724 [Phytophthora fragariae]